mmetsp:Transcript_2059/g.4710  ORF Transcript_2059/g.4710 Transcript_2059/m.4710 type:complete len:184 (+) Transcript_2059:1-552(+)
MQDITAVNLPRGTASVEPSPYYRKRINELYKSPGASNAIDSEHKSLSPSPWMPRGWTYLRRIKRQPRNIRNVFKSSGPILLPPAGNYETTHRAHYSHARVISLDFDAMSKTKSFNASPLPSINKLEMTQLPSRKRKRLIYKPKEKKITLAGLLDSFDTSHTSIVWGGVPTGMSKNKLGTIAFN